MPSSSSGTGNSYDTDFYTCNQLFYRRYVQGYRARGADLAPPLLVGTAIHKYAEVLINAFMAGCVSYEEANTEAIAAFEVEMGDVDPENVEMMEREQLARLIVPMWGMKRWAKLDSGVEHPIATELSLSMELPATTRYGNIAPWLRTYTARLDYVFSRPGKALLCIDDWKSTKASSPQKEAEKYMMSDQHLGYVALWNRTYPEQPADTIMYSFMRLHDKITSASSFAEEERNVDDAQIADWYERVLARRAVLTHMWDKPREMWVSNTAPHGPCIGMTGRKCEYYPLCHRPSDAELLLETKYLKEAA